MEEYKETSDNQYSECQLNSDKKDLTKHKKPLKFTAFIILFVFVLFYCFLSFFGAIPVPKWYMIANFYLNKNHFERLVDSDFDYINAFGDGIEPYISNTDNEKLQKSMRVIFKGIWGGMKHDDYQQIYFFYPFNFGDAKARGILYYEGSKEKLISCDDDIGAYRYNCYSLGEGWYYYEVAYKIRG